MSERISNLNSSQISINNIDNNNIVNNDSNLNAHRQDSVNGNQGIGQNQPDPGVHDYLNGNANSSMVEGRGQANNFAQRHEVISGKDWDFTDAESVRDLAKESFNNIKNTISGKAVLDDLDKKVSLGIAQLLKDNAANQNSQANDELLTELTALKEEIRNLKAARAKLTNGLSSTSEENDPIADLKIMKKTLRVFRYETQKIMNNKNPQTMKMDFFEGKLRGIQNFFTFGVKDHVTEQDFDIVNNLEQQIRSKLESINNKIQQMKPGAEMLKLPDDFSLESTMEQTLEISHRTNDQIRIFEKEQASNAALKAMLTPYAEKGGQRTVEFTAGLGAFIGLGIDAVTAGIRAGARFKVTGDIQCKGKGHPIEVTFRIGGGLEAKGLAKFGNEAAKTGVKAEASAGGLVTHFVTRTYPTLEDMMLDIDRCKLATSRTLGDAIVGRIKSFGKLVGNLGVKFFRFLGRHSGEVMQTNREYLDSLKTRGVINALDGILAKRANPLVVAERKGWTGHVQGQAGVGIGLGLTGSLNINASAEHQSDFAVKSKIFTPFARIVTSAENEEALRKLLRAGPDGVTKLQIPSDEKDLAKLFDDIIGTLKNDSRLHDESWAKVANMIRTLMIAVEIRCRRGLISRAEADRLLTRMTSPSVKIPHDIFREYLMEGTVGGKPAKIRNSAQVKVKLSILNDVTDGMTKGIGNVFAKAVAKGAVGEMRHQIGLDSSYQYVFTSEKPSPSSPDIRPWENDVKTSHSLVVTNTTPFRAIIDYAIKIQANNGQPPENQEEVTLEGSLMDSGTEALKEAGKSAASKMIVNTLIAGAKESVKQAVISYLSVPGNVDKILDYIQKNAGAAFETVLKVVAWAAKHPETALEIAHQAVAIVKGTTSLSESERTRTVKFNYINGEMESVSVSTNKSSSLGVNIDPLGVGLGVGLDVKYTVTESLNDHGILVKPTMNSLLSLTESFMLANSTVKTIENSESLKNYISRNIKPIKDNYWSLIDDKTLQTYIQAKELCAHDPVLKEKLESAWQKLHTVDENSPDNEVVDALHDFLMATTRAYRVTLPVEEEVLEESEDSSVIDLDSDDSFSVNSSRSSIQMLEV